LLLVDQRMSMFFGSQRYFKSVTAAQLATVCAWMALQAGDRVGAMVLGEAGVEHLRPLRSRARVQALCAAVVRQSPVVGTERGAGGRRAPGPVAAPCIGAAGHDHLVCVISDLPGSANRPWRCCASCASTTM
jgi:uncharacterized protein (DUF58 family)